MTTRTASIPKNSSWLHQQCPQEETVRPRPTAPPPFASPPPRRRIPEPSPAPLQPSWAPRRARHGHIEGQVPTTNPPSR